MTNATPPESESSRKPSLGFDEFIGIFVAFTTIGGILFWVLSQKDEGFKGFSSLVDPPLSIPLTTATPTPTAAPNALIFPLSPTQPAPLATPTPAPRLLIPTPSPGELPKTPTPIPTATRIESTVVPAIPFVVTPPPPPRRISALSEPVKFTDVPDTYWATPFIVGLQKRGIANGYSGKSFKPNQPVTRTEFAVMVKGLSDKSIRQAEKFNDIPSNFWAQSAITKANQTGYLKGYPGNIFRPQQPIPKYQVIIALANGLGLKPPSDPAKTLQIYKDANQIPAYARNSMAAATQAGLVVNSPNPAILNPNKNATRAEVSALLYQALVKAGKAQPVNSKYIVKPK